MKLQIIDIEKVIDAVSDLSCIEKDKSIKSGLAAAGNVFKAAGIRNINRRIGNSTQKTKKRAPGNLKRSVTGRVKKRKPGVLVGFANPLGNHSHLVNSGSRQRFTKKGKNSGVMPANEFWYDAVDQNKGKAIDELHKGIERAVMRINDRK